MKLVAKDGKWYRVGEYVACCDCELTHKVEYKIKDNKLYMRAWRDLERTDKNRKAKNIKVKYK